MLHVVIWIAGFAIGIGVGLTCRQLIAIIEGEVLEMDQTDKMARHRDRILVWFVMVLAATQIGLGIGITTQYRSLEATKLSAETFAACQIQYIKQYQAALRQEENLERRRQDAQQRYFDELITALSEREDDQITAGVKGAVSRYKKAIDQLNVMVNVGPDEVEYECR